MQALADESESARSHDTWGGFLNKMVGNSFVSSTPFDKLKVMA